VVLKIRLQMTEALALVTLLLSLSLSLSLLDDSLWDQHAAIVWAALWRGHMANRKQGTEAYPYDYVRKQIL
jgi:hypothetical protein